jgi:hypothetical protein
LEIRRKIMNTLPLINTRNWLLVPAFAALAAYAQASQAAVGVGDAQSQVRAVLEGTTSHLDSSRPAPTATASRVADVQELARQILLGTLNSNTGARVTDGSVATTSAGLSGDVQKQTQRIVLGRAAS